MRIQRLWGYVSYVTAVCICAVPFYLRAEQVEGDPIVGKATFLRAGCHECHGTTGSGGGEAGPSIAPNPLPLETVTVQLRTPTRDMPPYPPSLLTDADIKNIYAYLQSIPVGKKASDIDALSH